METEPIDRLALKCYRNGYETTSVVSGESSSEILGALDLQHTKREPKMWKHKDWSQLADTARYYLLRFLLREVD